MRNFTLLFVVLFFSYQAYADSFCERLDTEQNKRLNTLLSEIKLYDCCDDTVENCLKKEKVCRLAVRIKEEICLLLREKVKDPDIKTEIMNRAKSMSSQLKRPEFELDDAFMTGDKDAKVTIVSYICARCPFCAIVTPKLYKEVTEGRLKGKAKLYIRPFPLKSHDHSVEGGLALVASAKMGKFYEYLIRLQEDFNNFSVPRLNIYAADVGLNIEEFEKISKLEETKKYLEKSKKEGLKNGVDATPTFYINGKKYYANYYIDILVDTVLEEYDRVTGDLYLTK